MNTTSLSLAIFFCFAVLTLHAQKIKEVEVPEVVRAAFSKMHPEVKDND